MLFNTIKIGITCYKNTDFKKISFTLVLYKNVSELICFSLRCLANRLSAFCIFCMTSDLYLLVNKNQ